MVNCQIWIWNLFLTINKIQHICCVPFRRALRPVGEIEVILDSFICSLHTTVSAVRADTNVVRINRFRLYPLTAVVSVTTISRNFRLETQDVNTSGPSMAVCQRILGDMIQRLRSEQVLSLLNRFINEKIEKIRTKLDQYIQLTDLYSNASQHEC